jgi:NADPH:quinone reductase-like Zn-dependent oxidoreductase
MKAVGLRQYLSLAHPESLLDVELPKPTPVGHDVLVSVRAIAVNPVDTKERSPSRFKGAVSWARMK